MNSARGLDAHSTSAILSFMPGFLPQFDQVWTDLRSRTVKFAVKLTHDSGAGEFDNHQGLEMNIFLFPEYLCVYVRDFDFVLSRGY